MLTGIMEETARNHSRLLAAGLAATQKLTDRQLAFAQNAAAQLTKVQLDLATQATTTWMAAATELNQLWRETIVRAPAAPTAN